MLCSDILVSVVENLDIRDIYCLIRAFPSMRGMLSKLPFVRRVDIHFAKIYRSEDVVRGLLKHRLEISPLAYIWAAEQNSVGSLSLLGPRDEEEVCDAAECAYIVGALQSLKYLREVGFNAEKCARSLTAIGFKASEFTKL